MSLINDALKQAQKNQPSPNLPPAAAPPRMPPSLPSAKSSEEKTAWLIPVLVIALIVAAIFIIGLASSRNSVAKIVAAPPAPSEESSPVEPRPAPVAATVANPAPMDEAVAETPVSLKDLPRLQGIFYSPTSPSAIIDGKTVRPGENLASFYVKQINKTTVILIGKDGKPVQLTMN